MADFLEDHRNTVGAWLKRPNKPNPASVRLWAEYTGFPYEWLRGDKWPGEGQSVANDDQAELPAAEWLREISAAHQQISAALQQIADQLDSHEDRFALIESPNGSDIIERSSRWHRV
jgi:hypothetical protein